MEPLRRQSGGTSGCRTHRWRPGARGQACNHTSGPLSRPVRLGGAEPCKLLPRCWRARLRSSLCSDVGCRRSYLAGAGGACDELKMGDPACSRTWYIRGSRLDGCRAGKLALWRAWKACRAGCLRGPGTSMHGQRAQGNITDIHSPLLAPWGTGQNTLLRLQQGKRLVKCCYSRAGPGRGVIGKKEAARSAEPAQAAVVNERGNLAVEASTRPHAHGGHDLHTRGGPPMPRGQRGNRVQNGLAVGDGLGPCARARRDRRRADHAGPHLPSVGAARTDTAHLSSASLPVDGVPSDTRSQGVSLVLAARVSKASCPLVFSAPPGRDVFVFLYSLIAN